MTGAVSPPYYVACPLSQTALLVEESGLAPYIQLTKSQIKLLTILAADGLEVTIMPLCDIF
jgi:hypothetical protein